jgi:hypothetical protein
MKKTWALLLRAILQYIKDSRVSMKMKTTMTLRYGPTNRESVGDEEYVLFQSWYQGNEKQLFSNKYFTKKILPQLKTVKFLEGGFDYYRGVPSDVILSIPRMGPCPKEKLGSGNRYNSDFVAFYLAETELAVKKELKLPTDGKVCILKYTINSNQLRIADLTDDRFRLVNELMFLCELCGEESYPSIQFSQRVGKYLSSLFDCVLVRGVRGDKDYQYNNLVWFNKLNNFTKYINGTPYIYW